MQRSVAIVLTAVLSASALVACSGGKQNTSSSTTTTTTTQTSPAASPGASPTAGAAASPAASASSSAAASPAATSATMTKTKTVTTTTTTKKTVVASSGAASAAAGQKIYTTNCSSCHQATGKGQSGMFPPLDGNPVVTGPAGKVISIVKNGLSGKITVHGATFNGQMPAWKGTLSDNDVASVITYIRSAWSNKASAVTPAQVAAVK